MLLLLHDCQEKSADLDKDVDLRAGVQGREDGGVEGLLEVHAHLLGLAVTAWPSLALTGAEGGHAVLAVYHHLVVQRLAAPPSHLHTFTHWLTLSLPWSTYADVC